METDGFQMSSSSFAIIFLVLLLTLSKVTLSSSTSPNKDSIQSSFRSFDRRKTITHSEAISIYNNFALSGHIGGKDASSGYGGPAVRALVSMANFGIHHRRKDVHEHERQSGTKDADGSNMNGRVANGIKTVFPREDTIIQRVLDYGCGQGKLAEHIFNTMKNKGCYLHWHGVDQSPEMIAKFQQRLECFHMHSKTPMQAVPNSHSCSSQLMQDNGDPLQLIQSTPAKYYHRFVSTYCLDLMSERDMYAVLSLAEHCLDPVDGKLLLAGITYGYRDSFRTFWMTLAWELMYRIRPSVVGGCRPQRLGQYLEEMGWRIEKEVRTMPVGFPWMVSEVIRAKPPLKEDDT